MKTETKNKQVKVVQLVKNGCDVIIVSEGKEISRVALKALLKIMESMFYKRIEDGEVLSDISVDDMTDILSGIASTKKEL